MFLRYLYLIYHTSERLTGDNMHIISMRIYLGDACVY